MPSPGSVLQCYKSCTQVNRNEISLYYDIMGQKRIDHESEDQLKTKIHNTPLNFKHQEFTEHHFNI